MYNYLFGQDLESQAYITLESPLFRALKSICQFVIGITIGLWILQPNNYPWQIWAIGLVTLTIIKISNYYYWGKILSTK